MKQFLPKPLCVLCLLSLLLTAGCAVRQADMTLVSTRNVKLDKMDIDSLPQTREVVGKDSRFIFLFLPLGLPHLENAIDDALDKANGDLMTDAVLFSKGWWFLIGQNILEVKGTVVKTRGN